MAHPSPVIPGNLQMDGSWCAVEGEDMVAPLPSGGLDQSSVHVDTARSRSASVPPSQASDDWEEDHDGGFDDTTPSTPSRKGSTSSRPRPGMVAASSPRKRTNVRYSPVASRVFGSGSTKRSQRATSVPYASAYDEIERSSSPTSLRLRRPASDSTHTVPSPPLTSSGVAHVQSNDVYWHEAKSYLNTLLAPLRLFLGAMISLLQLAIGPTFHVALFACGTIALISLMTYLMLSPIKAYFNLITQPLSILSILTPNLSLVSSAYCSTIGIGCGKGQERRDVQKDVATLAHSVANQALQAVDIFESVRSLAQPNTFVLDYHRCVVLAR